MYKSQAQLNDLDLAAATLTYSILQKLNTVFPEVTFTASTLGEHPYPEYEIKNYKKLWNQDVSEKTFKGIMISLDLEGLYNKICESVDVYDNRQDILDLRFTALIMGHAVLEMEYSQIESEVVECVHRHLRNMFEAVSDMDSNDWSDVYKTDYFDEYAQDILGQEF